MVFAWDTGFMSPNGYDAQGNRWFILDGKHGYVMVSGVIMIESLYGYAPLGYDLSQVWTAEELPTKEQQQAILSGSAPQELKGVGTGNEKSNVGLLIAIGAAIVLGYILFQGKKR